MLIITGISNQKINELTINVMLCQTVTLFCRQQQSSSFQVKEKLKANLK